MRSDQRGKVSVLISFVMLLASGCEFFQGEEDTDFGDDSEDTDTGGTEDTGELPPSQGFRVFPKFMLQDLSAVVTIDLDGLTPSPCELDGAAEGGYLCDAGVLPAGASATILIEKDGFDSAVRHPQVVFGSITPLEVHLAIEGGPPGVWSACHPAGDFGSCTDLCATFGGSCVVTSCATGQEEWPLATFETFADAECTMLVESVALACENELPIAGTVAGLRCCCAT
jgi:hypothetical protein